MEQNNKTKKIKEIYEKRREGVDDIRLSKRVDSCLFVFLKNSEPNRNIEKGRN